MRRILLCMVALLAAGAAARPTGRAAAADQPSATQPPPKAQPGPLLFDLTLKGKIHEGPGPIGFDGEPVGQSLKGILDRLARAKADPNVKGLVLRLRDLELGWARSNELRQAIKDFRASGKKALAVLELAHNADYVVATAADEIVMPESGTLMLKGPAAEVVFFKDLFEKLDITPDVLQIGSYKAAAEPFTRSRMSPAFREELTSVLSDSYAMLAETIAQRQGIAEEEARKLIDGGPYTAQAAKAAGLVNRIAYSDQLATEIAHSLGVGKLAVDTRYGKKPAQAEASGLAGFFKLMQALSGEQAKKPASEKPKIALVYASGLIVPGRSSSGSLGGDPVLGAETLIKNLREAEHEPTVKAIVLRIDSPGGSALASDLIWRETVRIKKTLVASMSDVAGSGGYYIAMGCRRIFAEPGTITGSIGVVGGKIAFGGLLEKLGLTVDTVTVGRNGLIESPFKPFAPQERAAMRALAEETYRQFVHKAAQGRKMSVAAVEKLAGGRIYTGRQAKQNGLVDALGTLADAIASARELAGMSREAETEFLILPAPKGVLESFFEPLEDRSARQPEFRINLPLPEPARAAAAQLQSLGQLLQQEPILTVVPFAVRIR